MRSISGSFAAHILSVGSTRFLTSIILDHIFSALVYFFGHILLDRAIKTCGMGVVLECEVKYNYIVVCAVLCVL